MSRRTRWQVGLLTPSVEPPTHPHRHHHGEPPPAYGTATHITTDTFQTVPTITMTPSPHHVTLISLDPSSSITSPQPTGQSTEEVTAALAEETTPEFATTNTYTTEVCRNPLSSFQCLLVCMYVYACACMTSHFMLLSFL